MPRRCPIPARPTADSSGDESNFGGNTTEGNTSGVFNSDEDPYQLGSFSGTYYLSETDPLTLGMGAGSGGTQSTSRAETVTPYRQRPGIAALITNLSQHLVE